MKPCPTCGALLTESLVADIINPSREESCPQATPPLEKAAPKITLNITPLPIPTPSLAVLMMIGAQRNTRKAAI